MSTFFAELWLQLKYGLFTAAVLLGAFGMAAGFSNMLTVWPLTITGGLLVLAAIYGMFHRHRTGQWGRSLSSMKPHEIDRYNPFAKR